jgi:two-component system invasion response regulator UvrY
MSKKFLIIDDHAIVLIGIKTLLIDTYPGCSIDKASDETEALHFFHKKQYDLVIMDLNMTDMGGVALLRQFIEYNPDIKVLVLSMNSEDVYALHVLRLGAKGYVSKQGGFDNLKTAIHKVLNGIRYLSDNMSDKLLYQSSQISEKIEQVNDPYLMLTPREIEIVAQICNGNSTKEIANKMGLKLNTISTFKRNIFDKLQVSNVVDLIEMSRLYNSN